MHPLRYALNTHFLSSSSISLLLACKCDFDVANASDFWRNSFSICLYWPVSNLNFFTSASKRMHVAHTCEWLVAGVVQRSSADEWWFWSIVDAFEGVLLLLLLLELLLWWLSFGEFDTVVWLAVSFCCLILLRRPRKQKWSVILFF